jgi:acetyltransferase-like isoleucine patch superfamily enzyme
MEGKCWLAAIEVPRLAGAIRLGKGVALDRGVTLLMSAGAKNPSLVIGARTYINRHTIIDVSQELEIGRDCMIGPFCYLTDHDHSFGADNLPASGALVGRPTRIADRCWIGAHVTILKGIEIGEGAVIGAGAVVTQSVPAGMVAVGNPARVVHPVVGGVA